MALIAIYICVAVKKDVVAGEKWADGVMIPDPHYAFCKVLCGIWQYIVTFMSNND